MPIFPRLGPPQPHRYAVCAKCKRVAKTPHGCGNDTCGWFLCQACGVLIERGTGRAMSYPGMRK